MGQSRRMGSTATLHLHREALVRWDNLLSEAELLVHATVDKQAGALDFLFEEGYWAYMDMRNWTEHWVAGSAQSHWNVTKGSFEAMCKRVALL